MRFYYIAFLGLLSSVTSETCSNTMYNVTKVSDAHNGMLNGYYASCGGDDSCNVDVSTVEANTQRNYGQLSDEVQVVGQYETVCNEAEFSICKLDIEYKISNANVIHTITEYDKPFCFPYTCSESQVELMDVYLPSCTSAGDNCVSSVTDVQCPVNRTYIDSGNCATDLPSQFNRLSVLKSAVYTAMDSRCTSGTITPNGYCKVERSDAEITSVSNLTLFSKEERYASFAKTCVLEGGLQCEVSYTLETTARQGIVFTDIRTFMPICLPNTCSSEADRAKTAEDIILHELATSTSNAPLQGAEAESVCAVNPSACTVKITSLSCENSPPDVPPTDPPTIDTSDLCPVEDGNTMYSIESVEKSASAVEEEYFAACTDADLCTGDYTAGTSDTVRDYTGLDTTRLQNTCGNNNRTICTVDIDYKIATSQVSYSITETAKPFCFPSSCNEDDIELMAPFLPLCGAAGEDCDATIKKISCPDNRVYNNTGTCEGDLARPIQINVLEKAIETTMDASCLQAAAESNENCQVELVKPELDYQISFDGYEKESLTDFAQTCVQEGGLACEVSYYLRADGLSVTAFDTRLKMPMCFPKTCVEEDDQVTVVEDIIYNELAIGNRVFDLADTGEQSGVELNFCAIDSSVCTVDITSINCENSPPLIVPTTSPTVKPLTSAPVAKPKVEEPAEPVEDTSGASNKAVLLPGVMILGAGFLF